MRHKNQTLKPTAENFKSREILEEKICYICSKSFVVVDTKSWVYRKFKEGLRRYYCSWKCFRQKKEVTKKCQC